MLGELVVRFALGGAIVAAFALLGEVLESKTFAGVFGGAPSVAIATLALAYAKHGAIYAATEARSMLVGAAAFGVYSMACVVAAKQRRLPVWLGAEAACCLVAHAYGPSIGGLFLAFPAILRASLTLIHLRGGRRDRHLGARLRRCASRALTGDGRWTAPPSSP